ncbi:MAG: efflux RND transporter periplasmic adaptor subunit [Anaerolineae bacterium]|nr:efflux RND transporter periplasmic adaptor subunit [Anaerolineae bacterium]
MLKSKTWWIGLMVVTVLMSGCGGAGQIGPTATPISAADTGQENPTPVAVSRATGNVILMDGELVAVYPSLRLAFGGNVSAKVKTLNVQIGQRVKAGELIAALDDTDLLRAVEDAQLALTRAQEDLTQAQADAEERYQDALENAREKYDTELENAQNTYDRELQDAQTTLENAQSTLARAKMQPPTTNLQEAKVNLDRARESEADAADNYKQALDRPWEKQSIRDSYYEEWQRRITDRQLAELRYKDAQISLDVYYFDLRTKERDVTRAQKELDGVEMDTVEMDEVDKEDNFVQYERAVQDTTKRLTDAQEDLDDIYLYAPWDGLVTSIDTNVGAMVSGGTNVVTLLNVSDLYFITDNLSERHVAQVFPGQEARITLRTYPDTVVSGTVEVIIPNENRKTDSDARFTAYIRLDPGELNLLPGMTGRVEIVTE